MGKVSFHNDHGLLSGLADDDHPQYVLHTEVDDTPVDGATTDPISSNWAFDHLAAADPHSGYRLESVDHSHQSSGLQGGQLDHGLALTGLLDDDHTQYLLVSGSRAMTGDLDMGGNDIFNVRNYYPDPGGRLTLTTATPVMVNDVVNATTIYYALYKHDLVPLYDGTNWDVFRFTELSIALGSNWAANSNYDCYVYNDGGTLRLVTGAAWTSGTIRNESLTRLNGRWTNNASMTGRYSNSATVTVAANQGLYVGTFRTTASTGTTTWELGGDALGGDPGLLYVWNTYNRVAVGVACTDNTNTWTYNATAWRQANNSAGNQVAMVRGLDEDEITSIVLHRSVNDASGNTATSGVGVDSSTTPSGFYATPPGIASTGGVSLASWTGTPGVGFRTIYRIERCSTANVITFHGDANTTFILPGFVVRGYF